MFVVIFAAFFQTWSSASRSFLTGLFVPRFFFARGRSTPPVGVGDPCGVWNCWFLLSFFVVVVSDDQNEAPVNDTHIFHRKWFLSYMRKQNMGLEH